VNLPFFAGIIKLIPLGTHDMVADDLKVFQADSMATRWYNSWTEGSGTEGSG
jgi:hypothetical protein